MIPPCEPDAIIVGAGPAGVAAALRLARAGARVVLVERDASSRFKPGEILEATVKYPLNELGLADGLEKLGSLPIAGNVSIWGTADVVEADGILNPHGFGYLVDRARMEEWLLDEARGAGVIVHRGIRQIRVEEGSYPRITWIDGGRHCETRAPIIIDATGRGPGIVERGARTRFDMLVALLTYVTDIPERPRDQRLYIEAAAEGWWYSAPLPDGRTVIAFMTDADFLPSSRARRLEFFRQALARTLVTRTRVADVESLTTIRACPAMSTRRAAVSGRGWVAVGDAASTYDPLSGHGVAAALSKGSALARLLVTARDVMRAGREYAQAEASTYQDYLAAYRATYGRERRWARSEFWKRRQLPHRSPSPLMS